MFSAHFMPPLFLRSSHGPRSSSDSHVRCIVRRTRSHLACSMQPRQNQSETSHATTSVPVATALPLRLVRSATSRACVRVTWMTSTNCVAINIGRHTRLPSSVYLVRHSARGEQRVSGWNGRATLYIFMIDKVEHERRDNGPGLVRHCQGRRDFPTRKTHPQWPPLCTATPGDPSVSWPPRPVERRRRRPERQTVIER